MMRGKVWGEREKEEGKKGSEKRGKEMEREWILLFQIMKHGGEREREYYILGSVLHSNLTLCIYQCLFI